MLVFSLFAIHCIAFFFSAAIRNYPLTKFTSGPVKGNFRKNVRYLKIIIKESSTFKKYALILDKLFPKNTFKNFFSKKTANILIIFKKSSDNVVLFRKTIVNFWSNWVVVTICKSFIKRYIYTLNNRLFMNRWFIHPFRFSFRAKRDMIKDLYKSFKSASANLRFHLSLLNQIGFSNVLNSIESWILPIIGAYLVILYLMVNRCMPFNKTMFIWFVIIMFGYWLISGFVFFIKKYQFSKFTSAIQRFWRRSYILFWLIEFSLFSVFFYLTLNSNNESWYMYDQLQINKTGVFSWRTFLIKIFPLTLLLIVGYLLLLGLKWNIFNKHILWLFVLTNVLLYIIWSEFYQFFHAVNFYGNFNWTFDADEKVWSLELELRKTRTLNHYVMLMVMLKFWHIVVIFLIWIFFILRSLEIGRVRYPLYSANLQNFLILYLFAWVMMFPWLKFILRKYLDMPYYWFYVNNRELSSRTFFGDFSIYYYALLDFYSYQYSELLDLLGIDFFYFPIDDVFISSKKSVPNNLIISNLIWLK